MNALGQVSFFASLILVIVIHEAAHFGVARAFRIKVTEFFVGFGPKIWSTRRGETEVGFKWIPAGGYVKIAGMNPYERVAPEDLPGTYGAKPRWQRALVIVAGPATHFVLAFVLFALWLGLVGQPTLRSPVLAEVPRRLDGMASPAFQAGLRPGDRIVAAGDLPDPSPDEIIAYTQAHAHDAITLTIERDGERLPVTLTPVITQLDGQQVARIGVVLGEGRRERSGAVGAFVDGAGLIADTTFESVKGIGRVFGPGGVGRVFDLVFTDAPREASDPASIFGVGQVAGTIASGRTGSVWDIVYLFGLVNVFVGLLNLLPLPPFDGGHLAVLAIEAIRRRDIDMRKVIPVSATVAAFFILFTLAVVYVDLIKPPV
ncbi:MAG TPA: site-2 protease family protein [Actinomycetota bacterium]|nr:site-2 protease family protein [Actinomycetota bacterium]